jgi:hypothetical protein
MAQNLETDSVSVALLSDTNAIHEGSTVKRTGRVLSVPVGEAMLGRVVNALGEPIDGKGPIVTEQTRPVWVRILCGIGMFSMALHVRLSGADMHGIVRGLPMFALLAVLVSLVITVIGGKTIELYAAGLQKTALLIVSLFGLILLFALVQLVVALVYRLLYMLFVGDRHKNVA